MRLRWQVVAFEKVRCLSQGNLVIVDLESDVLQSRFFFSIC